MEGLVDEVVDGPLDFVTLEREDDFAGGEEDRVPTEPALAPTGGALHHARENITGPSLSQFGERSEVLRAGLDNYVGVSVANTNFPALQEVKVGQFPGDGETLGEAHVPRAH